MAVLKKYNLAGKEVGQIAIDDNLLQLSANTQMIKDYLVALRANARQWSANTKTRAEVNHSGKKPHPQKGTGRARQGYLGAPQYKGGGRVHAPRPKFDQHVRINRKEKRAAIRHLLIEKILSNRLHVLEYEEMKAPKTKAVAGFMNALAIEGKRVLFLGDSFSHSIEMENAEVCSDETFDAVVLDMLKKVEKFDNFVTSMRNIPKTQFMHTPNVSGYDVIVNHEIVVVEDAIDQLKVLLGAPR